jgi:hypothetical protein
MAKALMMDRRMACRPAEANVLQNKSILPLKEASCAAPKTLFGMLMLPRPKSVRTRTIFLTLTLAPTRRGVARGTIYGVVM